MGDYVVLRAFPSRPEAELVEELLRAGGIDARLGSEDFGGYDAATSFAGGVTVLVPSGQVEPAEDLLSRAATQQPSEAEIDREAERAGVKPVPEGYHTLTPYLVVRDAARLIDFLRAALGARELVRHVGPGGRVMNAELEVGDSRFMIGEAHEGQPTMPACLLLYVDDADTWFRRAVEAGGEVVRDIADQFYGDRSGGVRDPAGNQWWISSRIEELSPEEVDRRAAQQGS